MDKKKTLLEEYWSEDFVTDKDKKILFELMADLTDRRGLRQTWEEIDEDVQNELLETWLKIIKKKRI